MKYLLLTILLISCAAKVPVQQQEVLPPGLVVRNLDTKKITKVEDIAKILKYWQPTIRFGYYPNGDQALYNDLKHLFQE